YRFDRYDVSMRLQHLSNAGIKNPNPGVNFLQVRFQYWLDKP
ncbi:MAG TPA: acyloxyacyl hydrolase, partial [Burkholderiales bacterium]|nr:acyloxyacyl hydrolase [Burkholderiales bacterium]